ncbi:hypothetical protein O181_000445 [Austropuccinia psidii MF-1]|uniref:Uncharacterized protein n=1 Tax=Austropuccinia psidii MF-1 TaxID=1389203 RepID=A0A9Q3B8X4_9BASI|nr:hypothetical protein [Austropuccinia psidii MF-1]
MPKLRLSVEEYWLKELTGGTLYFVFLYPFAKGNSANIVDRRRHFIIVAILCLQGVLIPRRLFVFISLSSLHGENMVNSLKTALIFFTLQSCAHCAGFPGISSWLSRAGKAGEIAADGGKAENGAKTGADLRGAHVDPAHADGGSLGGKIGSPNTRAPIPKGQDAAPRTKISIAANKIRQVPLAAAIKAGISGALKETSSKAMDIFANFAPNLYRRLRILKLNTRPRELQNIATFEAQFKVASASRKFRMMIDTFHSLTLESVERTTEELEQWAQSVGNVMHIENERGIQSTIVEAQLQWDLCNLLLEAVRRGPESSLRAAAPKFKDLEVNLYDRAQVNPQAFAADRSYLKLKGGAEATKIPKEFEEDDLFALIFEDVIRDAYKPLTPSQALNPLHKLIDIMKDDVLDFEGYSFLKGFKASNKYTLEQRMSAASAIADLYLMGQKLLMRAQSFDNGFEIVRETEAIFYTKSYPRGFLHPNYEKIFRTIKDYKHPPLEA